MTCIYWQIHRSTYVHTYISWKSLIPQTNMKSSRRDIRWVRIRKLCSSNTSAVWFPGAARPRGQRAWLHHRRKAHPLISEQVFGPPNTAAPWPPSPENVSKSYPDHPFLLFSCRLQMSPSRMRALLMNRRVEVPHLYPGELSLQTPN